MRIPHVIILSAAVWAVGCGDGGTEPTPRDTPNPPRPTTVIVSPATVELVALGWTAQLSAQVLDQNGSVMAGAAVTWTSGIPAVATVDGSGLVTSAGNGTTEITASAGGASGAAAVTVAQAAAAVTLSPAADTLATLGDTLRLAAAAFDASGREIAGAEFSWASSNDAVATVDGSGLVTSAGNGTTEIAAASGAASETASVTVAQEIASLSVLPTRRTSAQAGKQGADSIRVAALDGGGSPVAGASYRWSTDLQSGWVYPSEGATDELGRLRATWVAGWPGEGILSLTVENEFSRVTEQLATLSTTPANPPNGSAAIWIYNSDNPSAGYSIDMTPLTEPTGTYYAAINWDGGYAGLQRGGSLHDRQLLFSVWDVPGHGEAELIDKASDVECRRFVEVGETGTACELEYPWTVGSTYRFEVTEKEMNQGSAMTLHVSDLAAGSKRFVGTIRFARRTEMAGFFMFVDDFARTAEHCVAREVRRAAIRRPRALLGGAWVALDEMTRGTLTLRSEDPFNPGTPDCANLAVREHAAGLELVIGGETASDPNASRIYTIPRN